ncbi:hypothetical protein SAMN05216353_11094 [Halobacillus alkaliphilus]|uniref:Uncharacterized protein n=1 Tax=Halobacillus alkaliphilus TaxID=396056 RepID=A0A1I2M1T4_9BACI|nr:hypothetical protein SAMN05216353_11094 [Halobacillus alkaliphilus]
MWLFLLQRMKNEFVLSLRLGKVRWGDDGASCGMYMIGKILEGEA